MDLQLEEQQFFGNHSLSSKFVYTQIDLNLCNYQFSILRQSQVDIQKEIILCIFIILLIRLEQNIYLIQKIQKCLLKMAVSKIKSLSIIYLIQQHLLKEKAIFIIKTLKLKNLHLDNRQKDRANLFLNRMNRKTFCNQLEGKN